MSTKKNRRFKARDKKRKIANNKEKRKRYNICRQHRRRQYKHAEKVQKAMKYVEIFTKEKLCNAEILVLAKGLKFIPSPRLQNAKKTLINDFNELARKMRCKYHFDDGKAIVDEVVIIKAGKLPQKEESPLATATFLTNAKSRTKSAFKKNERSYSDIEINTKQCAFCHEIGHTPVNSTTVTTANARMNIVKSKRLCFNCLCYLKFADCKSKRYCRNCNKRHDTSICSKDEKSEKSNKPPAKETGNMVLNSPLTQ
ncbi:unnamed protein product [Mytilus coruscus]|uniref:Uncharacterized protein n=1 Tax=Mytilus coruscus TaxID=42192 RepID=A0A6J8E9X5_MYTCO|nr:unnamed protein product [Mytilus coruscus]